MASPDLFSLTAKELEPLLDKTLPLLPDLEKLRSQTAQLALSPQTKHVLGKTEALMPDIRQIPQTSYTHFRYYQKNGDRSSYEKPYFEKRTRLAAAALRLFLKQDESYLDPQVGPYQTDLKDVVQNYLWNICEESNWVLPAHEYRPIDLFSAETSFVLAETLTLLDDVLDGEVKLRVRREIETRTFEPYLKWYPMMGWYDGTNNWNGVCNSSVMASFLHLWPNTGLVAEALAIALGGLRIFLDTAFESDGSSTEGVAYWHYGLINFVALSEMLRACTQGKLDLLDSEYMRKIAAYPAKMQLSGQYFASFSDCDETVEFNPGIICRLAERTGENSLSNLLAQPVDPGSDWRLTMMLRNLLWWDGKQNEQATIEDAVLPVGATAKLTGKTAKGAPIVAAIKAGHNAENHNQNDIGSFLIHVAGENLLTDPGRGLYNKAYFSPQRYNNIFANSYGHSVPQIAGQLQQAGRDFKGELLETDTDSETKVAIVEFSGAYDVDSLERLERKLSLAKNGVIWLEDRFVLNERLSVQEAFITWGEVALKGNVATIAGKKHSLKLSIEAPEKAVFALEALEEASRENWKEEILKRLTFSLAEGQEMSARVRIEVLD
ncbi:MAG: heparinase II/III family protein [Trueperaceae bacterium]|nr:heparinase II/III family protein [Trueperaceae bacterium]